MLNTEQQKAVETIDGPVMVIAGPGTGKTQILTLRIAEILQKTDTTADSILCLTFTNAGVTAMKKRLRAHIGNEAEKVTVKTFHSFAEGVVKEFYGALGFTEAPEFLDDTSTILLIDEILEQQTWQYLRPRSNKTMYVGDIKSLISLLKRDRYTPALLREEIVKDIAMLRNDPASISSRGESKGLLKKEVLTKIESLERTLELADFYTQYETIKRERGFCDFNDILEYLVQLVEVSEDVAFAMRERYLYVLVDEHQDSSGVQNEFLSQVWADQETQNIFVVGDDRQLIYGFGGASLSYFEGFKKTFPSAVCITLLQNYRSTQSILDVADTLLASTMASGALQSNSAEAVHPVQLIAADYERDEIIAAGLAMKERILQGIPAQECALLVPKNSQVQRAVDILRGMGIAVAAHDSLVLFDQTEAESMMTILRAIASPFSLLAIGQLIVDPIVGIPALTAQRFLFEHDTRKLTVDTLLTAEERGVSDGVLFTELGKKIQALSVLAQTQAAYYILQEISQVFFITDTISHETMLRRVEIVRGFLHLVEHYTQRDHTMTLEQCIVHIDRFIAYGEKVTIPLLTAHGGVQVMTLHASKGLEFSFVWVAHCTEKGLAGKRPSKFTLPQSIRTALESQDEQEHKRKLYVAITRAKQFCTISYPVYTYKGDAEQLALCVSDLPDALLEKKTAQDTEAMITAVNPLLYLGANTDGTQEREQKVFDIAALTAFVSEQYHTRKLSVTMLNNFFSCPWQWYFRNFIQLPEPQSESLGFGNVVHNTIEAVLKLRTEGRSLSEVSLESIIAAMLDKNAIYTPTLRATFTADALRAVQYFLQHEYTTLADTYKTEQSLSVHNAETPDLTITGKIDLVEYLDDATVLVTDFKTGTTRKKTEIEKITSDGRLSDYMRQLAMYSFLLQQHSRGIVSVERSRLCFLEEEGSTDRLYSTHISDETVNHLLADIKEYDTRLKDGSWVAMACGYKGWGANDTCPYCARAAMYR